MEKGEIKKKKGKRKEKEREIFKDDIKSLDGFKTERQSMQNYRNPTMLRKPRKILGIIPEEEKDILQIMLLPPCEWHPNY